MNPQVSVVIAAYNVQACLARTVESVLTQDLQNFEIVIVDDGSSDSTVAVAQKMALRDSRIRVFALPRNQGPSAARNRGLAEARGDWIAILDADDVFLPNRLGHLLELAARRGADMVADDLVLYDLGADQHLPPAFGWTQEQALTLDMLLSSDASLETYPLGWVQPIWRRDFLRRNGLQYPVQYRYMEDFFLLASALLCGATVWLSPRAQYVYTMRFGPISKQASRFSATQPSLHDSSASVQELVSRYRSALLPHQVRVLRSLQRRLSTCKAMHDAIHVRRERGLFHALMMLRRHPAAAWRLAVEKVKGVAAASWRQR
ncbi:hypothetical protein GCM10027034_44260 [Ramlibacter solisilvae]|uniref:glycosyltransferase family 2 protein n=1 Tax=Ramlibacter tataouinensis TaxID=94132 RepID=UPI0007780895|nr:glycosyltransferase family 2 protein [Ramlibacter tataouinensis]